MTSALELRDRKATFSLDTLECSVCLNIPSPTTMIFCTIGHLVCSKCRPRLAKCGLCQSDFKLGFINNVLRKVLDSVQLDCQFADVGCPQKVNLSDRRLHETNCKFRNRCKFFEDGCHEIVNNQTIAEHEKRCYFRPIFCFNRRCQTEVRVSIPIPGIVSHYISTHQYGNVPKITINNMANFEFSKPDILRGITLLVHDNKIAYVFVANFGLDDMGTANKACLISTKMPDETAKLNCSMTFKVEGNEVLNYTGKVMSIDDTWDIHSIQAGGLIYPSEFHDKFNNKEGTFSFSVFQIQ